MDMNQLFYHHQMALMAIAQARGGRSPANIHLPAHYAQRIEDYRADRGMAAYFIVDPVERPPITGAGRSVLGPEG